MKKRNVLAFVLILGLTLLVVGCRKQVDDKPVALDMPGYSLAEGSYTGEQKVTITAPEGDEISVYYTTDKSQPTKDSPKYEEPLVVSKTTTLKSVAIDKSGNTSSVKEVTYTIADAEMTAEEELAAFKSNVAGQWKRTSEDGVEYLFSISGSRLQHGKTASGVSQNMISYEVVNGSNGEKGYYVTSNGEKGYIDCSPPGDGMIYVGENQWFYVNDQELAPTLEDGEFSF